VVITVLGAGAFLAIAAAWMLVHRAMPVQAGMYVGTTVLLIAGAVAWGARLGDFNMFHMFFGGIVVFATPVAAIAVWSVWMRLRASGRPLLGFAMILLCVVQIGFGAVLGVLRLQRFGPGNYEPVPLEFLTAIRGLPADAKIAYSCQPSEEIAIWDARLLGIGAHTARRIIPMCFESDSLGPLTGGDPSLDVVSPYFQSAPQRMLYPDASSTPSSESIAAFLEVHGIDYIYADGAHPNALVSEATEIASTGEFRLLRVP